MAAKGLMMLHASRVLTLVALAVPEIIAIGVLVGVVNPNLGEDTRYNQLFLLILSQ